MSKDIRDLEEQMALMNEDIKLIKKRLDEQDKYKEYFSGEMQIMEHNIVKAVNNLTNKLQEYKEGLENALH